MKKFLYLLFACAFFFNSAWKTHHQSDLKVIIKGVKNSKGSVLVALSTDEQTFLKKFDYGKKLKSAKGEVEAVFENLPPGEYALSVIHDENDNGKLDTNALGVPKEGFGFGNGAKGKFGPPPFKDTVIKWAGGDKQEVVELIYL